MGEWSLRTLLNPVIVRLLINGINPIDLECILSEIESIHLLHSRQLETVWFEKWSKKAERFLQFAEDAKKDNRLITAENFYMYAAQCFLACFMVNFVDIELKKTAYLKYADCFFRSVSIGNLVKKVSIPVAPSINLSSYLFYPERSMDKKGSIAFLSGLGSCKEEMLLIARSFTERGITVLIPDMPGNGESLIINNVTCGSRLLKESFRSIADFLKEITGNQSKIGVGGLCMGGGYALNAAALDKRYSFCCALFPLFINETNEKTIPRWMHEGAWHCYQTGDKAAMSFRSEMGQVKDEFIACPTFVIQGKYDNWVNLDGISALFETIQNENKKMMIIEDTPVFSKQDDIIHAMPVGEQLHWVKHLLADWVADVIAR